MDNTIYKIVNTKDGKFYIGITCYLSQRMSSHMNSLRKNKHHNHKLQAAYNEYGEESFAVEIIEENLSVQDGLKREKYWIAHFDAYEKGYNLPDGSMKQSRIKRKFTNYL